MNLANFSLVGKVCKASENYVNLYESEIIEARRNGRVTGRPISGFQPCRLLAEPRLKNPVVDRVEKD